MPAKKAKSASKPAAKKAAQGAKAAKAVRPAKTAKTATASKAAKPRPGKAIAGKPAAAKAGAKLLSGGNPQIAKGDGDAPVQAYIAAVPGWKRDVARRIDALVTKAVPHAKKAVRWNSPMYGIAGQGWFVSMHVFTNYVKVAFFQGASLRPLPPGESKQPNVRYLDVREGDALDEAGFVTWCKQAAEIQGWGKV